MYNKMRCIFCGLEIQTAGHMCPACKAWQEARIPPSCRICGKRADARELLEWEQRRNFRRPYGAGRHLCRECRGVSNSKEGAAESLKVRLSEFLPPKKGGKE